MKIDWIKKLTSRKLWIAVAGLISGLILAFGGSESVAATVSGCVLQVAAVVGYLLAEGLTDAAAVNAKPTDSGGGNVQAIGFSVEGENNDGD